MRITLKTIADESGFSITTVSRALAGYSDVNEETRRQIIEIAESLGYQPNFAAQYLRSKKTNTVGMVIPHGARFSDPFFMELLSGVGWQAFEQGYDLLLSTQMSGEEEQVAYRRIVGGGRVDGIVVARILRNDPRIAFLKETQHPFIAFGRTEDGDHPYIEVDGADGMKQLVTHFFEYGHQRIALIKSPDELAFTDYRCASYRATLKQLGLVYREDYIEQGTLTQQSGKEATLRLLNLPESPTAIIACNDLMALGAISAIKEQGLTTGVDVVVAGFDDIPAASLATPSLSTVSQPIYDIGRQLAAALVKLIKKEPLDEQHVLLKPKLIIRDSSGNVRP